MRVRSFTDHSYPHVSPSDLLTNARALLRDLALRMLPVIGSEGRLEGVVTRIHVLSLSSTKSNALVRDVMDPPKLVFSEGEDAVKAFHAMVELDVWYAPVVNDSTNKYLGVISLSNYLRSVLRGEHPRHGVRVSELMTEEVIAFTPEDPVSKVWRRMLSTGYSGFPVIKRKDVVVGMITQHDLLRKGYTRIELESESGPRLGPKVREAMTSPAITVGPQDPLQKAVNLMVRNDIGRLPVVNDGGRLLGIIDRSDAVSAYFHFGTH